MPMRCQTCDAFAIQCQHDAIPIWRNTNTMQWVIDAVRCHADRTQCDEMQFNTGTMTVRCNEMNYLEARTPFVPSLMRKWPPAGIILSQLIGYPGYDRNITKSYDRIKGV